MTTTLAFGGAYDRILEVPAVAREHGLALETRILPSPKDAFTALRDDPSLVGGEMSVSFYLTEWSRTGASGDLVALPVWVSRAFRHSNVFVRDGSDLRSPAQLRGRTVGLPEYGMTMAVWLRGMFAEEHGLAPADVRWMTHRAPAGLVPAAVRRPAGVEVVEAPSGRSLPDLLCEGVIDAWIGAGSAPPPPGVRRLYEDSFAEERRYFARTGIFPVMHVLVLRRSFLEHDPGVAEKVFAVFDEAKRRAQRRLWSTSVPYVTLPWILAATEDQAAGVDPWPYGLAANRPTVDALVRYLGEQDLLWGRVDPTEAFLPLEPSA